MAGIWENWHTEESVITNCCIVTQNPNKLIEAYHDRMPVILDRNYDKWLDTEINDVDRLKSLLVPLTEKDTRIVAVSKK